MLASRERAALQLVEEALDRPVAEREAFVAGRTDLPPQVRERARQLLVLDGISARAVPTGGPDFLDDDEPPAAIGAYRILRCLGRGGMGGVYLAERMSDDFEHRVAIKLIKSGILSEPLIERFRRERQILAALNHPHIAHFHDGGETPDGQPYIVMEYVEGVPLGEWIERTSPDLDRRLALFAQICEAVGFAHQSLIIHRDLTPNNVLVTDDGRAKVIDFGIAQLTAGAEAKPLPGPGAISATPGFAAPERAGGGAPNTRSDIYSLGMVLAMLTGSSREPEIRAIVARATRKEPDERYASTGALLDDLRNFQRRLPVSAYSSGRRYRLRKFVSRERVAVGAAASVILVLIAGLGGVGWAYSQSEAERRNAQQRFAETRDIARTMMFDVYDEVSRVPGSTRSRLLLAETAQRYLDSLAADRGADVDVRFDAGRGYFRLAQVVGARTGAGTLGRMSEGKRFYARSHAILEQLHAHHPQRQDIRAALGTVLAAMADGALFTDGDYETARRNAVQARALLAGLDELDAEGAGALAATYLHEGNSLAWEGKPEQAGAVYAAGLASIDALPGGLRDTVDVRRARAELLRMNAAFHAYFGRTPAAREALERSLAIRRAIAAATRNAPRDSYDLAVILQQVGQSQLGAGDAAGALASATEATALLRRSIAGSPEDVGPRELFTAAAIFEAKVLGALGRPHEATALADEAISIKRALLPLSYGVVSGPMTLAVRLQEASTIYLAAGQELRACAIMRESVGIIRDYEKTAKLPVANRVNNLEPMLASLERC